MNKNVEELSEIKLKAIGYENALLLDQAKGNLTIVQQELLKREQAKQSEESKGPTKLKAAK